MPDDLKSLLEPGSGTGSNATGESQSAGAAKVAPVPKNLLDTKSRITLQEAEDGAGSVRAWQVMVGHKYLPGEYDAAHLRDIHAHVMQDIYPGVGATRNDELLLAQLEAKQTGKVAAEPYDARLGTNDELLALIPANQVNARLDELSADLKKDNSLRGLEKPAFVEKLTDYYLQYSKVSPFSAGNEHVLGVVFSEIGVQAGYVVQPEAAPHLREATDAILASGLGSDRSSLVQVFATVTKEADGIGPKALRDPTLSPVPHGMSPEKLKRQVEEDMVQAGIKLAGRVGGEEGERFKAGMRALAAGNSAPEHINVVRTTALAYAGKDLPGEVKRIEQGAAFLDNERRAQQQQERSLDRAGVVARDLGRTVPSEITR